MKKPRFNSKDWEMINAYGYGWGYGVSGLKLHPLWGDDEEGHQYEVQGWLDGVEHYCCCDPLEDDSEPIDFDKDLEVIRNA